MKKIFVLIVLFLSGCSNTSESTSTNEISQTELEEAIENAYDEGYKAGNDEGYKLGYGDAMSELTPTINNLPSPSHSDGLNLFSDGMDWSVATNYNKKEFIRSAAEASGTFVTYSELENYVIAIDIYFETNSKTRTLKEALEDIQ